MNIRKEVEQLIAAQTSRELDPPEAATLSIGPAGESIQSSYSAGSGVWDITFYRKINPELLLTHASHLGLIHRRVREGSPNPVSRITKDALWRRTYPVKGLHVLKDA
jgi:hypothetical protein